MLVERALTAGRPVLGICLGAQLIAQVLGARVYAGERREVGWAPVTLTDDGRDDPVFGGGEDELTVFHMHGDTYELPAAARKLARRRTSSRRSATATSSTACSSTSSSPRLSSAGSWPSRSRAPSSPARGPTRRRSSPRLPHACASWAT